MIKRAENAGSSRPPAAETDIGERLLRAVREAVDAGVDPELALREAAQRYRQRVEGGLARPRRWLAAPW